MKPIAVRQPGLQVLLKKNIGRSVGGKALPVSSRFAGQKRTVDITPYIGEFGSVTANKSVRDPAGAFSITFSDKVNPDAADSMYGLIEPMDVIEIRATGDAFKQPTATKIDADGNSPRVLPIIMRGLVTTVRRTEVMTPSGQPQRAVSVTGQDYGKIWQMLQIVNSPFVAPQANLITNFPFFARFGLSMKTQHAEDFVKEVFDKIVNPYIKKMATKSGGGSSPLLEINTAGIQVADGVVSPFGVGGWQGGTIYSLLHDHCDVGPWNELYIDDREDGPYVVYRPNPFVNQKGEYIIPLKKEPDIVRIGREDVVSISVERSDANVANYFWVDSARFAMNYDNTLRLMSFQANPSEVYQTDYGNNDPDLYGFRRLQEATQQGGREESNSGNGTQAGSQRESDQAAAIAWLNTRRKQLADMNRDNVVLESGTMRLKGNEKVKAGVYLRYKHGSMESDYYVTSVTHEFVPFAPFVTTVQVDRGTGFADRVKRGRGPVSPYFSEMAGN